MADENSFKAYSSLNNHYQAFTNGATYPDYFSQQTRPQPSIANSIEFTDLTRIQAEDTHRRRRRSTTAQDKEAATNMRIVSQPISSRYPNTTCMVACLLGEALHTLHARR